MVTGTWSYNDVRRRPARVGDESLRECDSDVLPGFKTHFHTASYLSICNTIMTLTINHERNEILSLKICYHMHTQWPLLTHSMAFRSGKNSKFIRVYATKLNKSVREWHIKECEKIKKSKQKIKTMLVQLHKSNLLLYIYPVFFFCLF